jgi:hypothetical protein
MSCSSPQELERAIFETPGAVELVVAHGPDIVRHPDQIFDLLCSALGVLALTKLPTQNGTSGIPVLQDR